MPNRKTTDRRRRMGSKHLVLIAVLALLGAGGTFALVTDSAFANLANPTAQGGRGFNGGGGFNGQNQNGQNGQNQNGGNNNQNGQNQNGQNQNGQNGQDNNGGNNNQNGQDGQNGQNGQGQGQGLSLQNDFVDITKVQPNVQGAPRDQQGASTGTFTVNCGTASQGHNSDNFIVAPGVSNGAQHNHDYLGAAGVNANTTDDTLANAQTSCANGDQSTYYWPVVRDTTKQGNDANAPGGGQDGNLGQILVPDSVQITYKGNPTSQVTAMPRFLRIIMGDAKAVTNGNKNAGGRTMSCTGFENKVQLADKYPICPQGSKLVRTFDFPSCWDGKNLDSADHRSHVVFADQGSGACPNGFKAIPQLTEKMTFTTPAAPNFALDSFPDQNHKAITDHADFVNAMSDQLMNQAVQCINSGQNCQ